MSEVNRTKLLLDDCTAQLNLFSRPYTSKMAAISMEPTSAPAECIGVDDLRNLLGELRMMARQLLHCESHRHSFTPTALAMTALRRAKLQEQEWQDVRWENRAHFFSALATAMRHALIDHARHRKARGRESLVYLAPDESIFRDLATEAEEQPLRILLLEEALLRLSASDQRLAETIHQFYYLGYTTAEMARINNVSEKTIDRDLKKARTALRLMLEDPAKTFLR
jgi:RNA polymerase sigma factor (TIGR02999 family)